MNSTKEQIETIAGVINRTKENLKPISINFIFWGIFIIVLVPISLCFSICNSINKIFGNVILDNFTHCRNAIDCLL